MGRNPVISLVPTGVDLALYCGDRVNLKVVAKDASGALTLDGEVLAQIKAQRSDPSPLVVFAVVLDPDGSVLLSLDGAETAALGDGFKGSWDVQWTPAGSEPVTIVQGAVTAVLDVSR